MISEGIQHVQWRCINTTELARSNSPFLGYAACVDIFTTASETATACGGRSARLCGCLKSRFNYNYKYSKGPKFCTETDNIYDLWYRLDDGCSSWYEVWLKMSEDFGQYRSCYVDVKQAWTLIEDFVAQYPSGT